MASGTYADPYIVKEWAEFLEYNNSNYVGKYVKFAGASRKFIDLGMAYPNGTTGLVIYPNIIGNNMHWTHLCVWGVLSTTKGIKFMGTVENLFIDAAYMSDVRSAIELGGDVTKLHATCEVDSSRDVYVFEGQSPTLTGCQMEFKIKSPQNIRVLNGTQIEFKNCEIYYDWNCDTAEFNNMKLSACEFRGYVTATTKIDFTDVAQDTTETYPETLWDMTASAPSTTYTDGSSEVCFYNSDKMIFDNTPASWVAITTATIASETAMNNAGFTTGGSSPWNYTFGSLGQDDWFTPIRLGGFSGNGQLNRFNAPPKDFSGGAVRVGNMPLGATEVGRYAFNKTILSETYLPSACTYYSTSFNGTVHGGTLIDE